MSKTDPLTITRTDFRLADICDIVTPMVLTNGRNKTPTWVIEDYMNEEADLKTYTRDVFSKTKSEDLEIPCYISHARKRYWTVKAL